MAKKLNTEEYKNKVYNLVGEEYEVLGNYTNTKTKIKMKHINNRCNNHEYYVTPNGFIRGNRCPKCNNINNKGKKPKTTEEFKKEVFELVGNEYKLVSKYNGVYNKVVFYHNKCKKEWEVTPNAFISSGSRCFYCRIGEHNKNQRLTKQEYEKRVDEIHGDKYDIIGNYVNMHEKIKVRHRCEYEFYVRSGHLIENEVCPKCRLSKGEVNIQRALDKSRYEYEIQKKFNDLKNIKKLSYDFYLPEYEILIEYQGEHHFYPIKHFGGEEKYKIQVKNDCMKREYAEANGYHLIEIPYTIKKYEDIKREIEKIINSVKQGTLNQK